LTGAIQLRAWGGFLASISAAAGSLAGNFTWIIAGNVIYAACQWGLVTVLAKLGDTVMLGQYALGLAISAPILTLVQMNLKSVLVADGPPRRGFGEYLTLRLAFTAAGTLIILGIGFAGSYSTITRAVIVVVGVSQAVEGISDIYYGLLQKQENMRPIALSMIGRGLLSVSGMAAAVSLTHSALWGAAWTVVARALVLIFWDIPQARYRRVVRPGIWTLLRSQSKLAATAFPLGVVLMLGTLAANLPRYAIGKHRGLAELGLFAAVSSLISVGSTLMNALGTCAMPRLVKLHQHQRRREFASLAVALVLCGGLAGLVGILAAGAVGGPVLALLFRKEYAGSQALLVDMMIVGTVSYLAQGAGYVATALGAFWSQVPAVAGGAIVSAGLSFILIPRLGLSGGACAIGIASAVQFAGTAAVSIRALRKPRRAAIPQDGTPIENCGREVC
jgi:O-antigen/teichoic acid export membrane protein